MAPAFANICCWLPYFLRGSVGFVLAGPSDYDAPLTCFDHGWMSI